MAVAVWAKPTPRDAVGVYGGGSGGPPPGKFSILGALRDDFSAFQREI